MSVWVELKTALIPYGISAFIAHEDIAPSSEWQNEIDLALRSMHALTAILTPDFHASDWTDQEVGFAVGRGILVVPINVGLAPYGFIGKFQAFGGSLDNPLQAAKRLFEILLKNPKSHAHMRRGLAFALAGAQSYSSAISLSKAIHTLNDFTEAEKAVILRACRENDQVFGAIGVVARICTALGVPDPRKAPAIDEDIVF